MLATAVARNIILPSQNCIFRRRMENDVCPHHTSSPRESCDGFLRHPYRHAPANAFWNLGIIVSPIPWREYRESDDVEILAHLGDNGPIQGGNLRLWVLERPAPER